MTNKKVAVIIGGNSGVGKRTALDLARQDVNIIIVARNTNKGQPQLAYNVPICLSPPRFGTRT